MKVLLVFLVFFLCSYSSNAQLLDEGSTTTTEIESQGGVEEVTETTTTIEHKNTGDVLDGDTGIVTNKYEGDADVDWGGAGAIYSHSSCTDAASGFPATGTDGRTSACGHAKSNSLTTWRQYVDLNSFGIEDGGEVNYEFLFAFPNNMYTNANRTAFVQTKGYNDNTLQWETGLVTIDKTTFTQNPNNYNNNTNWVNTVTGSYDFANQLDKVYIEIGGYGEYYWDEFQYNAVYNHITTVVETWMQVVQQEQEVITTIDLMDNYDINDFDNNTIIDDIPEIDLDIDDPETSDMMDFSDIPDIDIQIDIPETDNVSAEMFEDLDIDMPTADVEEMVAEVQEMVAEVQEIDEVQPAPDMESETEDTTEMAENTETEEISESADGAGEPVEDIEVEKVAEENEVSEPETAKSEVEDPKETAKEEQQKETKAERKQEKAKQIIEKFDSQYDAVAQITTLALVNALGPNMTTYSTQVIQPSLQWYKTEEIYTDSVMEDPLGNYFGVRDSLVFEKMIGQQYE